MPAIRTVTAREILDSRGNPTVEATVVLANGITASASVPSGASTGSHEALELRDGDKKRYGGKGVLKAVKHINTAIAHVISGMDIYKQEEIDATMIFLDNTANKSALGANTLLAVSLACARAGSLARKEPLYRYIRRVYGLEYKTFRLPTPMCNVINGGQHADNSISTQEFMIIPHARTIAERVRIAAEVFHCLKTVLRGAGEKTLVGDEGGFAPNIETLSTGLPAYAEEDEAALVLIVSAIKKAGYKPGKDVSIGIDVAASELYDSGKGYDFDFKQNNKGTRVRDFTQMMELYNRWLSLYPVISIEDPFAEDNWQEWIDFTKQKGKTVQIVGDDLFVTNTKRLQRGIDSKAANAILIKLNQIGTLSETIDCIRTAQAARYHVVVSHRSGETIDTFISDLSVAVNADYIKAGSLSRSERVEKYNRLTQIERELKP